MRNSAKLSALLVAVLAALSFPAHGFGYDLCDLLGFKCGGSCGGGCADCGDAGCGCEVDCGCETGCGGEVGCGCEPACGCGCNGRQFAGQTWDCCNSCPPPICPCTGPECCESSCGCGCGDACGGGGGCDTGCGGEVGCGCEPSCGCGSCGCGDDCAQGKCYGLGFGSCGGRLLAAIDRCCGGCGGCSSEMYWSEWHNDPPRCCDPCDCYGNWIGPSAGSYRAPYDHAYSPGGSTCNNGGSYSGAYAASRGNTGSMYAANGAAHPAARSTAPTQLARNTKPKIPANRVSTTNPFRAGQRTLPPQTVQNARPINRGQLTRKPMPPADNTYQR